MTLYVTVILENAANSVNNTKVRCTSNQHIFWNIKKQFLTHNCLFTWVHFCFFMNMYLIYFYCSYNNKPKCWVSLSGNGSLADIVLHGSQKWRVGEGIFFLSSHTQIIYWLVGLLNLLFYTVILFLSLMCY
jgi:hypothetical protein